MKRKLKRLLRLRNKSGFTLVEVIIACALLGILVIGVMGFVTPVLNSVREKEKNARAYLLSEAINTYIAQTTQYAYYVVSITGAASGDTTGATPAAVSASYSGTEFSKKSGKGLSTLKTTLNNMTDDAYEVRCIGIRWREDRINGTKKLMLTNETVDQTKLTLDPNKSRLVFEECFYNGLYPTIRFENYDNQYQIKEGDTMVDRVEAKDVDIAPGLGIIVDVYTTLDCYSTDSATRNKALFNTEGSCYVGFNNIKSTLMNKGDYEVIPNQELNTYDAARAKDTSAVATVEGKTYYSPESFIYYIVRKTKT